LVFVIFFYHKREKDQNKMGNDLTTIVPKQRIPIESYLKKQKYTRTLGTTRFLKAALTKQSRDDYNVVKIFIIPEELENLYENRVKNLRSTDRGHHNHDLSVKTLAELLSFYKKILDNYMVKLSIFDTPNLLPYSDVEIKHGSVDVQNIDEHLNLSTERSTDMADQLLSDRSDRDRDQAQIGVGPQNIGGPQIPTTPLQYVTLTRPYHSYTLYDLANEQNSSQILQLWIIFQMLKCLQQLEKANVNHLDIKLENFLASQFFWVKLTDFCPFKPKILPTNDPSIFNFYFDTSRRRTCNVAPERFVKEASGGSSNPASDQKSSSINIDNKLLAMSDIFSLGCCIYEFLTTKSLFSLSEVIHYQKYREIPNNNLDLIENPIVKEMLTSMISYNPNARLTATEYLSKYKESLFPVIFYDDLYPILNSLMLEKESGNEISQELFEQHISNIYENLEKVGDRDIFEVILNFIIFSKEQQMDRKKKLNLLFAIVEKYNPSQYIYVEKIIPILCFYLDETAMERSVGANSNTNSEKSDSKILSAKDHQDQYAKKYQVIALLASTLKKIQPIKAP